MVKDQEIPHIVDLIKTAHKRFAPDYDKAAPNFWQGDGEKTARALFAFCKQNILYDIESDKHQTVKGPGAIMHDGHGDCKHYASFINGILSALHRKGYPVAQPVYRFAGYIRGRKDLHHVFAVLPTANGDIWIDPVLPSFNNRKPYYSYQDHNAGPNRIGDLFLISGIENTVGKSKLFDKIKHGMEVNAQNLKKGIKITAKKALHVIPSPVMVGRNAFLALLKLNAFNMAHRLYDGIHKSKQFEQELSAKWSNMGGNYNKLKTAITQGFHGYAYRNKINVAQYNKGKGFVNGIFIPVSADHAYKKMCYHYPLYHPYVSDNRSNRYVGADPATIAALLTAAAGVIAALSGLLKKAGWGGKGESEATAEVVKQGANTLTEAADNLPSGSTITTPPVTMPDGSQTSVVKATVSTDADGNKVVQVDQVNPLTTDGKAVPAKSDLTSFSDTISEWFAGLKNFVSNNKLLFGMAFGTIVLVKVLPVITGGTTTRRKRK
jgi:hypothetical protein